MSSIIHHTKTKGDLGTLKVQADLAAKGFVLLYPLSEHMPFDTVCYDGATFYRVSVKTRKIDSRGCLSMRARSSYITKGKAVSVPIDKNAIDVLAIYCIDNDTCYYLNPNEFNKALYLRVDDPVNATPSSKIKLASNYQQFPSLHSSKDRATAF